MPEISCISLILGQYVFLLDTLYLSVFYVACLGEKKKEKLVKSS